MRVKIFWMASVLSLCSVAGAMHEANQKDQEAEKSAQSLKGHEAVAEFVKKYFKADFDEYLSGVNNEWSIKFFNKHKESLEKYIQETDDQEQIDDRAGSVYYLLSSIQDFVKNADDASAVDQLYGALKEQMLNSDDIELLEQVLLVKSRESFLKGLPVMMKVEGGSSFAQIMRSSKYFKQDASESDYKGLIKILKRANKEGWFDSFVKNLLLDGQFNQLFSSQDAPSKESKLITEVYGIDKIKSPMDIFSSVKNPSKYAKEISVIFKGSQNDELNHPSKQEGQKVDDNLKQQIARYMLPEIVANLYKISAGSWDEDLKKLSSILEKSAHGGTDIKSAGMESFFHHLVAEVIKNRMPHGMLDGYRMDAMPNIKSLSGDNSSFKKFPISTDYEVIANDPLNLKHQFTPGASLHDKSGKTHVGYYLAIPKKGEVKGTLLRAYGGQTKDVQENERYKGVFGQFDQKLLRQGYAVAYLNLADLHENKDFQAQMSEAMFNKVLDGIHVFINALKEKSISKEAEDLAEKDIFAMGESFGGVTVTGFMRRYPGLLTGGISWNGALSSDVSKDKIEKHLDPLHNAKDIKDPLLVLQAWNDNIVLAAEAKLFMERIKGSNPHVYPFMINMANNTADESQYIGHYLRFAREGDLDRVVQQVVSFLERPKDPSAMDQAVNAKREDRLNNLAALTNPDAKFDELMEGMFRIWYTQRLNQGGKKKDFEEEWTVFYLPRYIATILKMTNGVFEYGKQAQSEAKTLSQAWKIDEGKINLKPTAQKNLVAEMEKVGLGAYVTSNHVQFVLDVLKKKTYSKYPFSARVGLEAMAEHVAESHGKSFDEAKEKLKSWLAQADNRNKALWKESLKRAVEDKKQKESVKGKEKQPTSAPTALQGRVHKLCCKAWAKAVYKNAFGKDSPEAFDLDYTQDEQVTKLRKHADKACQDKAIKQAISEGLLPFVDKAFAASGVDGLSVGEKDSGALERHTMKIFNYLAQIRKEHHGKFLKNLKEAASKFKTTQQENPSRKDRLKEIIEYMDYMDWDFKGE